MIHLLALVMVGAMCFSNLQPVFANDKKPSTHEILTNNVHITEAPRWLKRTRVEKVIDRIQMLLEWDIRRIEVIWHHSPESFARAHNLSPLVVAFARKSDNSIHLSPKVDDKTFDAVFGHELVHVISYQKYKEAIPRWLEEGLANHLSRNGKVNYKWLAQRPQPRDVRQLTHMDRTSEESVQYRYVASQALTEMIAAKCSLATLLQLSVERSVEDYLATYCEIRDLNGDFKKWIAKKSR